ncbi:MAG: PadR family transcriptional regulator [Actinobacteria bacterium]|nr:PadR family transcriptional regulator [Actinomycetota bacterium]
MGETDVRLPATSYAVLGLLTFAEMSGYDLMKAVDQSIGFFWTPAKSHIYAELRRLVSVGYATEREVEQSGRPDKRLYAITPAGEEAFRRWLVESPVELEPIKSTFLLKLFFGHLMDPAAVAANVSEYRRQMDGLLGEFRAIERHIQEEGGLPHPYLTLKYGIAYAQAAIGWCDETLKELEGRGKKR